MTEIGIVEPDAVTPAPKTDEPWDKLHLGTRDNKGKPYALTLRKLMDAFVRRQAATGYSAGYLGHESRYTPKGDGFDRAIVTLLVTQGWDLEDMYHFLNSTWGRHLGDAMIDGRGPDGNMFKTRDDMWEHFKETPKKTAWSGWRIKLVSRTE